MRIKGLEGIAEKARKLEAEVGSLQRKNDDLLAQIDKLDEALDESRLSHKEQADQYAEEERTRKERELERGDPILLASIEAMLHLQTAIDEETMTLFREKYREQPSSKLRPLTHSDEQGLGDRGSSPIQLISTGQELQLSEFSWAGWWRYLRRVAGELQNIHYLLVAVVLLLGIGIGFLFVSWYHNRQLVSYRL